MYRRELLKKLALTVPTAWLPGVVAGPNRSAPAAGRPSPSKFQPTWESLAWGLVVTLPAQPPNELACAFRISPII